MDFLPTSFALINLTINFIWLNGLLQFQIPKILSSLTNSIRGTFYKTNQTTLALTLKLCSDFCLLNAMGSHNTTVSHIKGLAILEVAAGGVV